MSEAELLAAIDDPAERGAHRASELTAAFLKRIDEWQPRVNAFVTVMAEAALRDAALADERAAGGVSLGPVDGMVVAVKDDIDVAGVLCTVGSGFYRARIADSDAVVVRKLREAGAVVIGKAGLNEWAYGVTCDNAFFGTIRNPWDASRIPGGSSGGSGAAVAADLCIGALGSDAGGSVRVPAALCGVSGLRPTSGVMSGEGTHQICWSLETVGPMARSVADVARLFDVLADAAPEGGDPVGRSGADAQLQGLRVGLLGGFFRRDVDPEIDAAVHAVADVLSDLGAAVVDLDVAGAEHAVDAGRDIIRAEAFATHEERLAGEPSGYGVDVRERLELGRAISGAHLARAYEAGREWTRKINAAWSTADLLLAPTTGEAACLTEGSQMREETESLTRLVIPFSIAGVPALSVPCGLTRARLPIGAQLIGPAGRDALVLRVGMAVQRVTEWHRARASWDNSAVAHGAASRP